MKTDDVIKMVDYIKNHTGYKGDIFINVNIDAIPIDWIYNWAEKFYKVINGKRYYMGDGYDTVWDMLEDWKKENEESN